MRFKRTPLIRLVVDLTLFLLAGLPLLCVHIIMEPFSFGFFCDDHSIQHPYKEDTVPMILCAVIAYAVALASFFTIEFSLSLGCHKTRDSRLFHVIWTICKLMLIFTFGCFVTLILTETSKLSVGRLRPNFMDACKPNMTAINCSIGYIEDFVCTNTEIPKKVIMDSKKSFPSGHCSFVAFIMVFMGFYYQKRLTMEYSVFLKAFMQVIVAVLAFYVMCSRVTDYKHHWGDVIAGAFLGWAVGFWTYASLGKHLDLELDMNRPFLQRQHTTSPTFDTQLPMSDPCTPEPASFLSPTINFDRNSDRNAV